MDEGRSTLDCISPQAVACRWWWGLAAGDSALWTGADSRGWELHCVSSGSPRWGRCSRSACSPAAGSAGGSRSSWAGRWETSNSPRSSCPSPRRLVAPAGCRSCSASSSCWTSSGCRMSTPPPCASRRNWTDSIKQCSALPSPAHTVKEAQPSCQPGCSPTTAARGGTPHLGDFPHPARRGAASPCSVAFACWTIDMSQTGWRYSNMPKPQRQSSTTLPVCSKQTLFPCFPFSCKQGHTVQ